MKRFVKSALTTALLVISAQTFADNASSFSPAQKTQIEDIVHQYLVRKPEVIVEAMQVLQNKQFEQAKQAVKQTQKDAPLFAKPLFHEANDPVVGDAKGKITVVEFFDYQCPHCVDMAPVMDAVMKANPGVRIVFKEWPIRGPMSEMASRAALAANMQGKYLAFHQAILTSKDPLTQDSLFAIAKSVGLDVDKMKKDMNDSNVNNQLKTTMKLAQDLKLFGTPAFFVGLTDANNGTITYVPGQLNQDQLQDLINKAGK